MRSVRAVLALLGCLVACLPGPARADLGRTIVLVEPDASVAVSADPLADAVRGQLAELGVAVVLAPAMGSTSIEVATERAAKLAAQHHALAVFWLGADQGALVIHLYEPAGPHLRARRIVVSGAESAAAEEVAVIVRSASSALIDGTEVSMPEVALPRRPRALDDRPRARAPKPTRATGSSLRVALAYVGTLYAAKEPWQSGAGAMLSLRPGSGPWLVEAGYAYFPGLVVDRAGVRTSLYRHPIELGIGLEHVAGQAVLATEIGGLAEWAWRTTDRAEPPLRPLPAEGRWLWGVRTRVRGGWALGRHWQLFAAIGADFVLYRFDYVAQDPGQHDVLSPLSARPRIETGVTASLW
jgi:hypothetical protein